MRVNVLDSLLSAIEVKVNHLIKRVRYDLAVDGPRDVLCFGVIVVGNYIVAVFNHYGSFMCVAAKFDHCVRPYGLSCFVDSGAAGVFDFGCYQAPFLVIGNKNRSVSEINFIGAVVPACC